MSTETECNNKLSQNIIKQNSRFEEYIKDKMTPARALCIKDWRVKQGCSSRVVASCAYTMWEEEAIWTPPSNNIAGMVLCIEAANFLEEDFTQPEWNKCE